MMKRHLNFSKNHEIVRYASQNIRNTFFRLLSWKQHVWGHFHFFGGRPSNSATFYDWVEKRKEKKIGQKIQTLNLVITILIIAFSPRNIAQTTQLAETISEMFSKKMLENFDSYKFFAVFLGGGDRGSHMERIFLRRSAKKIEPFVIKSLIELARG